MAYSINGKVYTDHPLMDEIVYNCKKILNGIVIKNDVKAGFYETDESVHEFEMWKIINMGHATFNNFPFTKQMYLAFGYSERDAVSFNINKQNVPEDDREDLLKFSIDYFKETFVETNDYYRALGGLPPYDTGRQYYIMYSPNMLNGYNCPVGFGNLIPSDFKEEIDETLPLHQQPKSVIQVLQETGGIDALKDQYKGFEYCYLNFLGDKAIDDYTARMADKWDILYLPTVEPLVSQRFVELYDLNKEIFLTNTYQEAYKYSSDYYDQMMIICVLLQTYNDMIVDVPEWYIRRDIFDIRSVQYFLEAYGVEFFEEIPLKYQIRIVKNLNKLVKYKSSTQNAYDILDIFDLEGTDIYKYYIYKNRKIDKWGDYTVGTNPSDKFNLQFVATKLGDSFDNYIKDNINRKPYDELTLEDKYWDGLQTHDFIKNKILDKDFTLEGTKYMSVEYHISLKEYLFQLEYFLGLVLHSDNYLEDITVSIPSVSESAQLRVSDLFILLCLFSNVYENPDLAETKLRLPEKDTSTWEITRKDPDYDPIYHQINGGLSDANEELTIEEAKKSLEDHKDDNEPAKYQFRDIFNMGSIEPDDKYDAITYIQNDDKTYSEGSTEFDFGDLDEPGTEDTTGYIYNNPGDYDFNILGEETSEPRENIDPAYAEELAKQAADPYYNIDPSITVVDDNYNDNYGNFWQLDANGGNHVEYSEVKPDQDLYDWKKKYIPEAYVDKKNRVFGFNVVDKDKLNEVLSRRNSRNQFEKGYNLDFIGCGDYINPHKVSSIDELIKIYNTDKKCYDRLVEYINDSYQMDDKNNKVNPNVDNYDDYKIYTYAFEQLFTTDFDFSFYTLSNGKQATSLDEILEDRSYALYKVYKKVLSEKNQKTRKDNIRNLTNDIIMTLEYYINDKNLNYLFNFVSSNSFHALLHYMYLLINFFKSYKVYFLDPYVTYIVDDKSPLAASNAQVYDAIPLRKITYWKDDKQFIDDNFTINIEHDFIDSFKDNMKEIVDVYGRCDYDVFEDDLDYDGEYADSPDEGFKIADGGHASDESQYPYIMLNGGNAQLGRLDIWDLNGADARNYQEEFLDVDGGYAYNKSEDNAEDGKERGALIYNNIMDQWDTSGKTPQDIWFFHDQIKPLDDNANNERLDWFGTQGFNYIIDGGYASHNQFISRSMHLRVIDNQITSDVRISTAEGNAIVQTPDGLYVKDIWTNWSDFDKFADELEADQLTYLVTYGNLIDDIKVMTDAEAFQDRLNSVITTYTGSMVKVLNYMDGHAFENSLKKYTDNQVANLYDEFYGYNPLGWETV